MNNTTKTENITDEQIDFILDPVNLFMDTLDRVADGGIYPKEKLDEDVKRFCETYPDFKNGILKHIFKGFVLGMERADMIWGSIVEDMIKKSSESTATTTETTK